MKRKRLLLILLAILLIIGLGYAGWQQWGNKTPDTQQNTQTTDPSEGGKYLVIKEWGVRVSYEILGTKDTFYEVIDTNRLFFYKKGLQERRSELSAGEKEAFNKCIDYPSNVVIRTPLKDTDANDSNLPIYRRNPIKKIGSYGYFLAPPQAICPEAEKNTRVASIINEYVVAPYKSKRISAIEAFEQLIE